MANIKIFFRNELTDEISLKPGITTIGRLDVNDIQVDNLSVSGNHAQISYTQGQFVLQDLNSTNGTHVNGKKISAVHTLQDGDIIGIAKHTLKFSTRAQVKSTTSQHTPQEQHISDAGSTMMMNRVQMDHLLDEHRIEDASKKGQVLAWLEWRTKKRVTGTLPLTRGRIIIGKGVNADLQTGGWFAPRVSAAINYQSEGYILNPQSKAKVKINNRIIHKPEKLQPGDQIDILAITCTFFIKAITD